MFTVQSTFVVRWEASVPLTFIAAYESQQLVPVVFIQWKYIAFFGLTALRINFLFSGKLQQIYAVIQFSLGRS